MDWHFSDADRRQMAARGVSEAQVKEQLRLLARPRHYLSLARPCTPGDGIRRIEAQEAQAFIALQEEAARQGRFQSFIPASGAATRMFQDLYHCRRHYSGLRRPDLEPAAAHNPAAQAFLTFVEHLPRFALYDDLHRLMAADGWSLEECRQQGKYGKIIEYLLSGDGLNYGNLPKGLLKFHAYAGESRTALEEHLAEAAGYIQDRQGVCRLHFTTSPEHREGFENLWRQLAPEASRRYPGRFQVTFPLQQPATDTIAADLEGRPLRGPDGGLLFRPGGHGALLPNLNELQGDLIYIKNIDNVAPDRLKEPTVTWKKILGGYLIYLQDHIYGWLRELTGGCRDPALAGALEFVREVLGDPAPSFWEEWPAYRQREFLLNHLNRPLRVGGMVPNEGEPGGGPFWVTGPGGRHSRQIVESPQVDLAAPDQQAVWAASTHFNPVDLACGVRDFHGRPFPLADFVDPEAAIISLKYDNARELKALEHPGLWNGAMARWLTVFVEVPILTFNPVKTLLDLLRPQHQA